MTFVKQLDSKRRLVLRLWSAPIKIVMSKDSISPLWFGTATIEIAAHADRIGSLPRTTYDFVTPLRLLSQDARNANVSTADEKRGWPVVLLW